MRVIFALISFGTTLYFCWRMTYVKYISEDPLTFDALWLPFWAVVSCSIFVVFAANLRGETRRTSHTSNTRSRLDMPPVPTERKSKFDGISHQTPLRTAAPDGDAILAELVAMNGEADRPASLPAWAILLRDPFVKDQQSTSWFGGRPKVPNGFEWPRGRALKPLHFVAQFDLAMVIAEPETGQRPASLPESGAILFFVGMAHSETEHTTRILTATDMVDAQEMTEPDDIGSLRDLGFWIDPPVFPRWPLDLRPYLDDGKTTPQMLTKPSNDPADWMTNWGLAAYDAQIAIKAVEDDAIRSVSIFDWAEHKTMKQAGLSLDDLQAKHRRTMTQERPALLEALKQFRAIASSQDPCAPIDPATRDDIWNLRNAVAAKLDSFAVRYALKANPASVHKSLLRDYMHRVDREDYAKVPEEYRAFLGAQISAWHNHRLFGRALPPVTDLPDLRGLDCLVSFEAQDLMATETEHENGFSIWAARTQMAQGAYANGIFLRHLNV